MADQFHADHTEWLIQPDDAQESSDTTYDRYANGGEDSNIVPLLCLHRGSFTLRDQETLIPLSRLAE